MDDQDLPTAVADVEATSFAFFFSFVAVLEIGVFELIFSSIMAETPRIISRIWSGSLDVKGEAMPLLSSPAVFAFFWGQLWCCCGRDAKEERDPDPEAVRRMRNRAVAGFGSTAMFELDPEPELKDLRADDEPATAVVDMSEDDLAGECCQDGEMREAGMGQEATQEKLFIQARERQGL